MFATHLYLCLYCICINLSLFAFIFALYCLVAVFPCGFYIVFAVAAISTCWIVRALSYTLNCIVFIFICIHICTFFVSVFLCGFYLVFVVAHISTCSIAWAPSCRQWLKPATPPLATQNHQFPPEIFASNLQQCSLMLRNTQTNTTKTQIQIHSKHKYKNKQPPTACCWNYQFPAKIFAWSSIWTLLQCAMQWNGSEIIDGRKAAVIWNLCTMDGMNTE